MAIQLDPKFYTIIADTLEGHEQAKILDAIDGISRGPILAEIETAPAGSMGGSPLHTHRIGFNAFLQCLLRIFQALNLPAMMGRIAQYEVIRSKPYNYPLEKEGAWHQRYAPAVRVVYQQKNITLKFTPTREITAYEMFHCMQLINLQVPRDECIQYMVAHNVQFHFTEVPAEPIMIDPRMTINVGG